MKKNRVARILKFVAIGIVALTVFGFAVMALWNWLTPTLFGWHAINFWQALGLVLLSKILFGGFRGPGGRMHWRRRMTERWEEMTPEEREKFRQGLEARWGGCRPPAAETKA